MAADRCVGRDGAAQLVLLGERQPGDVGEPAGVGGVGDAGGGELVAVEGRAGEEVAELRADSGASSSVGARPRRWPRHQAAPAVVGDRFLGVRGHQEADRARLLLGEVGEQAGGAGEDRDRLEHRRREAEVEQDRGDRHRDVEGQRLAPGLGDRRRGGAGQRAVRAGGAALGGKREDALGARVERLVQRMAEARDLAAGPADLRRPSRRARRRPRPRCGRGPRRGSGRRARRCRARRCRSRGCRPPPRPAATPGSAASVIRATWLVGTRPCSAMATSSRSRKNRCSAVGSSPVEQQVEVVGEAHAAHQVAAEVAAAHGDRGGVGGADRGRRPGRPCRSSSRDLPLGSRMILDKPAQVNSLGDCPCVAAGTA